MCGTCGDLAHDDQRSYQPSADLNDDLTDLFGDFPGGFNAAEQSDFARAVLTNAVSDPVRKATFEEPCKDCRGTGRFYSYTGRLVGNCFKCKGTGVQVFKTSTETRQKQAEDRAARKVAVLQAWFDAHPAETEWLKAASARGFNFATDTLAALAKYGSLHDWKVEKVRTFMVQDQERAAARAAAEASAVQVEAASLAKIGEAFAAAMSKDIMYPKLRLDEFVFSLCRSGKNAGSIYVKHTSETNRDGEKLYLGRITDGKFVKAYACTPEWEQRIVAAASDPKTAAEAYGRREGRCSMCGRQLTNAESIELAMGPICRETWGW